MLLALCQVASTDDPVLNLVTIQREAELAAERGARIIVFPEAAMCRFGADLAAVAETVDGPWASEVRSLAARLDVVIVAGMFTPGHDGRVANTLLITGSGIERSYDKIHSFDAFGYAESDAIVAGSKPVHFSVDGVEVGVATCYDLRFPELFRKLASSGSRVIIVPASWGAGPGKTEQWRLLVRARGLDATSVIAACDQADPTTVGREPARGAPTGVGASMLVGPDGMVIAELDSAPGMLVVDVDLDQVDEVRQRIPVLANARPHLWAGTGGDVS